MSLPTRVARGAIAAYRRASAGAQPRCRYWPSCSEYADDAIRIHGLSRGTVLAVRRLARCHPWGGSGHDPVEQPNGCSARPDWAEADRGAREHVG